MNIRLGQKLALAPTTLVDELGRKLSTIMPCKVVYINRAHEYYTVEFEFLGGVIRESFKLGAGDRFE